MAYDSQEVYKLVLLCSCSNFLSKVRLIGSYLSILQIFGIAGKRGFRVALLLEFSLLFTFCHHIAQFWF